MNHVGDSNTQSMFGIGEGTVQCYVARSTPFFMHHFGRAEYDRDKPILSASLKEQAQPIVDALNAGEITTDEAKRRLDKIHW